MDRFWNKVEKQENGCWLWMGAKGRGYGVFHDGKLRPAHRIAYELLVGPIPDGLQLDHLCEVRACVNPDHLEPVTAQTNLLRSSKTLASQNAAKTHCPQGHPYDETNTYVTKKGLRQCRECVRRRSREYMRKRFGFNARIE